LTVEFEEKPALKVRAHFLVESEKIINITHKTDPVKDTDTRCAISVSARVKLTDAPNRLRPKSMLFD